MKNEEENKDYNISKEQSYRKKLVDVKAANENANRIMTFFYSGVIKLILGILLLLIGLTGFIGLIEVINNNKTNGIIYFSILIVVTLAGGILLIIWYIKKNYKGKTAEKERERLDEMDAKNSDIK